MLKTASLAIALTLVALPAMAGVTVKSCDRDVTFDAPPARAVANDVNLTEMMLALRLQDHMVGYTGVSGWKTLDATLRQGIGEAVVHAGGVMPLHLDDLVAVSFEQLAHLLAQGAGIIGP